MIQHFWLICGLWCGLGNGGLIWFRRNKLVESGRLSEEEVLRLAKGAVLWILVPSLILWVIQISGGTTLIPNYLTWPSPQRYFAIGLQVFVWLALAYWIYLKNGATTLSVIFIALSKSPSFLHAPSTIKLGTAAVLVVGVMVFFTAHT